MRRCEPSRFNNAPEFFESIEPPPHASFKELQQFASRVRFLEPLLWWIMRSHFSSTDALIRYQENDHACSL